MNFKKYIEEVKDIIANSNIYGCYYRNEVVISFQAKGISNDNLKIAWKAWKGKPFRAKIEQSSIIFYSKL